MSIVIRRARPGDHLLIRELQQEIAALHYEGRPDLFQKEGRFYSEEEFARLLANPDEFIWIAEADGKAVGYAFALVQRARNNATFRDFNRFYIDDVCVSSACQRQGIGRMLMDECKRQARLSHCHTIDLGVWSFNQNAIAFYESCGLKERERRMELILPDEEMIDVSGTVLETDRLILRPFRETDLEDLYAYASVEGVGESAGWPHHTSMETSRRVLDSFIRGHNIFAIVWKETGRVIGSLGLHESWTAEKPEYRGLRCVDVGYVLAKAFWGRGLMPEAVRRVIRYGFEECCLDALTVCHFEENDRSRRVIEKCGFRYVDDNVWHAEQLDKDFVEKRYILMRP